MYIVPMYKKQIIAEASNQLVDFEPACTIEDTFIDHCITRIIKKSQKRLSVNTIIISDIRDGIIEALNGFRLTRKK